MKKQLFLLALLCLSLTDTIGQNNTSFLQGVNQLETLYSNFQANNTPTGILYGQSLLTFNQDYYAFTNDTATHSRLSYEILHRTMYDCKTPNNTWLANPDPFLSDIRTSFDEPSNSVDFLLAAMHFNEIESSGNMDKIQLVNNALELNSGYTLTDVLSEKSAHASMLTKSRCFAGEVNFTLPSENIQSNVSIDALKISMDGISFTPLTIDSSYAYTLSPTENQAVYLQMSIAGQLITTKLLLDVIRKKDFQQENVNTRNPHDDIFHTTLPLDMAGRKIDGDYFGDSTIFATVLLSCGAEFKDIQKPFIVLDGIDLTWDQNFSDDNEFFDQQLLFADPLLLDTLPLRDYLNDNEYDIIFVDYSDHHISIKDNAAALINLIEKINGYKAANGSTHKNKMMGFSMGGVLGKWALLDMEENDRDHDVDKYFSFDSPMSGANISPALQGLIHQIADILTTEVSEDFQLIDAISPLAGGAGDALGFITGTDSVLRSPSPSELLFYKYPTGENELVTTSSTYLDFYGEFKTKGLQGDGTLVHAEYLSIANGSSIGGVDALQELSAGELMFELEFDPSIFSAIWNFISPNNENTEIMNYILRIGALLDWNIDIEGYALPGKDVNGFENKLYEGKIELRLALLEDFDIEINSEYFAECSPNLKPLDSAPGGIIDIGSIIAATTGDPSTNVEELANDIDGLTLVNPLAFCFIPTVSALNVEPGNNPFNIGFMAPDVNMTIERGVTPTINSRWAAEEEPPAAQQLTANTNHVNLDLSNVSFIANELSGDYSLIDGLTIGGSYNFGRSDSPFTYVDTFRANNTTQFIGHDLVVPSTSTIYVNHQGPIGELPVGSFAFENSTDSHFDLYLRGKSCSPADYVIVEFEANSELNIADAIVNNTGTVEVDLAELIFYNNSSLTMDDGSSLIIQEEGLLDFENGVDIDMHENSTIELKGVLRTEEDVILNIGGTFIIHPTAMFDLGGKLTINGTDITSDLLKIHGEHELNESFKLTNGTLTMVDDASLTIKSQPLQNDKTVEIVDVKLEQEIYNLTNGPSLDFRNLQSVDVNGFEASGLLNRTAISMHKVRTVSLDEVTIENCYQALNLNSINDLLVANSSFSSSPVATGESSFESFTGVSISKSPVVQITNCTWDGFGEYGEFTDYLYALEIIDCPAVDISDSEFTNNKTGINVPQDADQKNNTNLFITNSLFQNNYAGIEMYGYASDAVNIKSSGYLNMECVRMLDNYYGVDGVDILLQADFYFADEQSTANTFRPKNKNNDGGSPVTFHINYTTFSYSEIYLRGNIWYDFDGAEAIVNADGSAANVVKSPGIDGNSGPVELQCASISLDDDCKGCFQQEDDDDCTLKIAEENTNISSIYRDANSAVRNRDFALVEAIFEPLSTIANDSSISGLASKCDYQTHIARVFALPRDNDTNWEIGGRSKAEVEYAVVPNPSSESIVLEGLPTTDIMIFSSAGQMLMHFEYQEGSTIDISNLPSGLYTIVSANTKSTQRFIVMK